MNNAISGDLQYSCVHWFTHVDIALRDGVDKDPILDLLREFMLGPTLLFWLEALSLLSELKVAISGMLKLSQSVEVNEFYSSVHFHA